MPFGLKNAGATFQHLVSRIFKDQISKIVECYVYDMVAKSKRSAYHIVDLSNVFAKLRKFNLKLNPAKCAFGVRSGKFLGFMVSQRGIEMNPEKIAPWDTCLVQGTSKKFNASWDVWCPWPISCPSWLKKGYPS